MTADRRVAAAALVERDRALAPRGTPPAGSRSRAAGSSPRRTSRAAGCTRASRRAPARRAGPSSRASRRTSRCGGSASSRRCAAPNARSSSITARTAAAGSIHTSLTRSARSDAVQRASGPPSTLDSPSSQPGKQQRTSHEPARGLLEPHAEQAALARRRRCATGSPSVTSISPGASVRSFTCASSSPRRSCGQAREAPRVEEVSSGLRRARLCSSSAWIGEPANASRGSEVERERGGLLERRGDRTGRRTRAPRPRGSRARASARRASPRPRPS